MNARWMGAGTRPRTGAAVAVPAMLAGWLFLAGLAAAAEPVTLRYVSRGGQATYDAMVQVIDLWNSRNPDVHVELDWVAGGWPELFDRIVLETAAGNSPDFSRIGLAYWPKLYDEGLLYDMSAALERNGFRYDEYFPAVREYERDGAMLGLPSGIFLMAVMTNLDHFDAAGVAHPPGDWENGWTWDDFREAARKLAVRDGNGLVRAGSVVRWHAERIIHFIWQNGGEWFTPDGRRSALTEPEAVEALEWLRAVVHEDGTFAGSTINSFSVDFLGRKNIAMDVNGLWAMPRVTDDVRHGVAPSPRGRAGAATPLYIDPFVVLKASRHPEEATRVLQFFLSEEAARIFGREFGLPVNRRAAVELLPELYPKAEYAHTMVWVDGLAHARRVPFTSNWSEIMDVTSAGLAKLAANSASALAVAQEIADQTNALLAELHRP